MPSVAATDEIYGAFAAYPLRERIEGCPCCVAESGQLALHRVPLRQLSTADLGRYPAKAMTTWGDALDYRHFLPRILELSPIAHGDHGLELWLIASKLEYGGFASWPEPERAAVTSWMREHWTEQLDEMPPGAGLSGLAIALEPVLALDELLAIWSRRTSLAAALHLAEALRDVTSLRRGPQRDRLTAWLIDPARRTMIDEAFAREHASPHGDALAYAIDLWELLADIRR